MKQGGVVYIMTNKRNGTLYTGVTSDLQKRVWEHLTNVYPNGFTAKYGCHLLVYYCAYSTIGEAIVEEKRIKGKIRKVKLKLIEDMNPKWNDLWEEIQKWN
jgi:putative endonuclease